MSTGKELVRLMSTSIWIKFVLKNKGFCSAILLGVDGKIISQEKAKKQTFCHLKILFQQNDLEYLELLTELLSIIASTSNESMNGSIHEYYGFKEIIIS